MKGLFKKGWQEFWLMMKEHLKIMGIFFVVYIPFIILWFCLPEKIQQTIITLIVSAHLWIRSHHLLETAHYFMFNSIRIMLMCLLAILFFLIIRVVIALIILVLLALVKKDKAYILSHKLTLLEVGISFVVTCFVMTSNFPMTLVDTVMRFSRI